LEYFFSLDEKLIKRQGGTFPFLLKFFSLGGRAGKKNKNGCGGTPNLTERSEVVSRAERADLFIFILIAFQTDFNFF